MQTLQTASIVRGVPLLLILALLMVSMARSEVRLALSA
ncbi:hypothetical protein LLY24_14850 [Halomonas sp. wenzhen-202101]|uniref:Uncharacterized protein n=1 Tax=Halomonas dongshanensis TaxID=2890835 RepID=A0ABT2EG98_9GAMM|nr:hypothetical protein [Halomonas dongshanensis]MCS2610596.1 hypothetical protein [Halomonas dongshanensis]